MRTNPNKSLVLLRLTEGTASMEDLRAMTGLQIAGVASLVSRLRSEGFKIASSAGVIRGNPKYELLSGPGSASSSFICRGCRQLIHVGCVDDHKADCQFGPMVLAKLTR